MKFKIKKVNKEHIILIGLSLFIFSIYNIQINKLGMPTILEDELGYWANAAYITGVNWSGIVSNIRYYSYGYSLILVPLFLIFDNPIYMYRAAIFLNGLMLSISFLICYSLAKKIMCNINKIILLSVSFLIAMYPTYIVYSNITFAECMLIMICWILTWFIANINDRTTVYKFVLIGILCVYLYIVHQRTLGILLSVILVIIVMKITNKISIKQFLCFIVTVVLLLIFHHYLKNIIQSNLWLNGNNLIGNDYLGQIKKINELSSMSGLIKIVKEFIGQLFYLGVASYLIYYLGLIEIIREVIKTITRSIKSESLALINNNNFYLCLFLLIASVLLFFTSIIFMINPTEIAEIVFGRYNEIMVGPILLLGFANVLKKDSSSKLLNLILYFFCILTVITSLIIRSYSMINHVFINDDTIHSVGLMLMNSSFGIYVPAIIAIIGYRLILVSINQNNKMLLSIITIAILFLITGEVGARSVAIVNQQRIGATKSINVISSYKQNIQIYFLCDTENLQEVDWNGVMVCERFVADGCQYLLKNRAIKLVNSKQLNEIYGENIVITTNRTSLPKLKENYELITNDKVIFIFKSKKIID